MHQNKKQLEILLMNYFRESYIDFPKGIVAPSESPDFIVSFKNHHLLGIELTRLNPWNLATQTPEQIAETVSRGNIIELTREIFENHLPHQLFIKFLFSDKIKIGDSREMMLAVKLASIMREKVKDYNNKTFFHISLAQPDLPDE